MQTFMYTIYDVKAKAYLMPIFMATDAIAVRSFTNAINQEGHQFNTNPEDYTLHRIGLFDDETAQMQTSDPELIISGLQALNSSAIKNPHLEAVNK